MQPNEDTDDFDELDRLVDRELQALLAHLGPRRRAPERSQGDADPDRREPRPAPRRGDDRGDNVVRAHPLARRPPAAPPRHMRGLFAPEEEAFLANAADWLARCPNADILLETLARRVGEARELSAAPEGAAASSEQDRAREPRQRGRVATPREDADMDGERAGVDDADGVEAVRADRPEAAPHGGRGPDGEEDATPPRRTAPDEEGGPAGRP
ncbi:hypothetical protein [Amaricoccus solimangrovi]|uniref:Uncharacterized protein n=1 Tax=Amaricoccus solimangrovi TaxID=2589815 RepID=A0A501WU23_9RHOB|nr:hypothetical protein [Amaricoccus solimangrovi]TPE53243.1 hypothetical protein FJM51_04285 [Amaricoccus solimangrovi]